MARALTLDEWKLALWQDAFDRVTALNHDARTAVSRRFIDLAAAPTPAAVRDLTLQIREELDV